MTRSRRAGSHTPVSLEELVLAYLREPGAAALPGPAREPSEVTR